MNNQNLSRFTYQNNPNQPNILQHPTYTSEMRGVPAGQIVYSNVRPLNANVQQQTYVHNLQPEVGSFPIERRITSPITYQQTTRI